MHIAVAGNIGSGKTTLTKLLAKHYGWSPRFEPVDNIHKRGRDYEQTMPLQYLSNLNDRYEEFVMKTYKGRKLVIDVDNIDYKNNPEDFAAIVDKIDATMFGIFGPLD